jgi:hypothetical protein
MNWYIGQDIVAVRDHSQGIFKRGDEFKIKGLKQAPCNCKHIDIDVGFGSQGDFNECAGCGFKNKSDLIWWIHETCFEPLDPIKEAISELMERTQVTEI